MQPELIDTLWLPLILVVGQILAAIAIIPLRLHSQAKSILLFGILYIVIALIFCDWYLAFRDLSWHVIGFTTNRALANVGLGIGGGVCTVLFFLGFQTLLYRMKVDMSQVQEKLKTLTGDSIKTMLAFMLIAVVGGGLVEEILFRGLIMNRLQLYFQDTSPALLSMVFSSLLFGVAHYPMMKMSGFVSATVAGLILAGLLLATGSLVAPIIAHALTNAVMVLCIYNDRVRFYKPDVQAKESAPTDESFF